MAESVSAIVGLVSAAVSLAERIYSFTSKVRNAPEVARDISFEITLTKEALDNLGAHLRENNAMTDSYDRTTVLYCAVDGCNRQLQKIDSKISALLPTSQGSSLVRLPSLINGAKWALAKDDVMEMIQALRGYMHVFHFAVNLDGMNAIKSSQDSALSQIQERLNQLSISPEPDETILLELLEAKEAVVRLEQSTANDFQRLHDRLDEAEKDTRLEELIAALQSLPYQGKHWDVQQRRQDGLGQWLLEEAIFRGWEQGTTDSNMLWCPGAPGVGKTYLASVIVDYLEKRYDGRVLYFYFDYREQSQQTPFKVLITLLRQALSTFDEIPTTALDLHQRTKKGLRLPSWDDLIAVFSSICAAGGQMYLVLDALDESDEHMHREDILHFVEQLVGTSVRVLLTSRPYPWDIHETFSSYPQIPMKASPQDIRKFLERKIATSRKSSKLIMDDHIKQKIIESITAKSNGMFLLPALQILNILGQTNKRKMMESLERLPTGLMENLDLTLERIRRQDADDQTRADLAMATLKWIATAKRPLTSQELQHAIATIPGWDDLDDLTLPVMFVESCCGLVTIDSETDIVRFVHFSVSEYLEARRDTLFPRADAGLAISCLTYLMLFCQDDAWPHLLDEDQFAERTEAFHLLDYAAVYWGVHAAICYADEVRALSDEFMESPDLLSSWNQRLEYVNRAREDLPRQVQGITRLHVAARFSLQDVASSQLASPNVDPNCVDSLGRTPLMLASGAGSMAVLQQLLSCQQIQVDVTNEAGKTALWCAVESRQQECARALLAADADPNLGVPLLEATEDYLDWNHPGGAQKSSALAEMLLASPRINVNVKEEHRHLWVSLAVRGDIHTMKMLLARPEFDMSSDDQASSRSDFCAYLINTDYQTEAGIVGAVRMLALLDGDSRFVFDDFKVLQVLWNPLNYAFTEVERRRERRTPNGDVEDYFDSAIGFNIFDMSGGTMRAGVRRALDAAGLSMAFKDSRGRHFMHFLAYQASNWDSNDPRGFGELITMLASHGMDVNDRDKLGRKPLSYAVGEDNIDMVQQFLDAGSLVEARDARDMLHAAVDNGHEDMVQWILDKYYTPGSGTQGDSNGESRTRPPFDIDAAAEDDKCTALHLAVFNQNEDLSRLLLLYGANPDPVSVTGPAIHYAMMHANLDLTALLVDGGADLNVLDCFGKSAWDRIAQDHPNQLVSALGLSLSDYNPTEPREARRAILESILWRLRSALDDDVDRVGWLYRVGQQLIYLGDEAGARFAFDSHINKDEQFRYICCAEGCRATKLPTFVCKQCTWNQACVSHHDATLSNVVPGMAWCQGHEFLKVPSEGWMKKGQQSKEESAAELKGWLEAMVRKYEAEAVQYGVTVA